MPPRNSTLKPFILYECVLCKRSKIPENKRRNHHKNFHLDIPYADSQYVFLQSVEAHAQCIICDEVVARTKNAKPNHHKSHHSEFFSWQDLFETTFITTYANGKEKTTSSKPTVQCSRCNSIIDRRSFVEHYEREHPKFFLRNHTTTKMDLRHDTSMDGTIDDNDIAENNGHLNDTNENAVENHDNHIEVVDKYESSQLEKINYFKCTICNKEIKGTRLPNHHKYAHSETPYEETNFILVNTKIIMFQCYVCQAILTRPEKCAHHKNYHPEFIESNDVCCMIILNHNVTEDTKRWSPNKDAKMNSCKICKKLIDQSSYVKHFQQKHPHRLISTDENYANDTDIANKNEFSYSEKLNYFTCKLCHIEIKEKFLKNHHYKVHFDKNKQYQANNFILAKSIITLFQCFLCHAIVERRERQIHHRKNHPEFAICENIFNEISFVHDVANNTKKWSVNKDTNVICCKVCYLSVERKNFVGHFQEKHSDQFNNKEVDKCEKNDISRTGNSKNSDRMIALTNDVDADKNDSFEDAVVNHNNEFYEKINHFECKICTKSTINASLHHAKYHRSVPYRYGKNYTLQKTVGIFFQCFLCKVIVRRPEQQIHQQNFHPEFIHFNDVFVELIHTYFSKTEETTWSANKDINITICPVCSLDVDKNTFVEHFEDNHPERLKSSENHKEESISGPTPSTNHVAANNVDKNDTSTDAVEDHDNESCANDDDASTPSTNKVPKSKVASTYYECKLCKSKTEIEYDKLQPHHSKFHRNKPYQEDNFTFIRSIKKRYKCLACHTIVRPKDRKLHHDDHHTEITTRKYLYLLVHLTILPGDQMEWSENKDIEYCKLCKEEIAPNTFVEHFKNSHPEWCKKSESTVEPPAKTKNVKVGAGRKRSAESESTDDTIAAKKKRVEQSAPVKIKKEKVESAPVSMPPVKIKSERIDAELIKNRRKSTAGLEIINYFKCTLCGKSKVKGKKLLKHHEKFHRGIPYEVNTYILNTKGSIVPDVSDEDETGPNELSDDEEIRALNDDVQLVRLFVFPAICQRRKCLLYALLHKIMTIQNLSSFFSQTDRLQFGNRRY